MLLMREKWESAKGCVGTVYATQKKKKNSVNLKTLLQLTAY